ncbi:glutamic acid-rich protein-like [Actinia tenebrosa]|uniref:Glutamic acid-rich protein-like n=1 Tax=Actinia tenebrosa TaxID=6105 RepID=A0A6P8HQP6_ACTTE|nr:glutamic acid-rich protein-like [Actinia tenebrosa]
MMGERLRLCAACSLPSPGPTKRLYYQHRDYGPFFPILEEQRRKSNGYLFSGGRVVVCTGCASHLLRQWAFYEKNWTPLEKRTYTLLSEERMARKAKKDSFMSKVSMGTDNGFVELNDQENHLSKTASKISSRDRDFKGFNQETMSDKVNSSSLNERLSPQSFISEGNAPFRRALKKVSKQNTRILAEYNEANKHSDLSTLQTLEKSEEWNGEERMDSKKGRSHALWNLPSEDIRSKVREELEENIDVMIRKVAEIQHYENLRRYELELKEAAERMCKVQDSKGDIDRMCQSLKSQLQEELLFRDTLRVLNEEGKDINGGKKALMSIEPPASIPPESHSKKHQSKQRLTGVTNAKKAGKEWKGKTVRKKLREKASVSEPTENSLALVPCPTEEESGTSSRNDAERATSASRKLDTVVRELEKEREWRKRTEGIIVQQREMIEELRNGIQGEVKRLIEEQNKRYHEIKANAGKSPRRQQTPGPRASPNGHSRPSQYKTPYISLDRASSVDHDATRDGEERMILRERRRRQRKDRSRDQWEYKGDVPLAARSKKYDDDDKSKGHGEDDDDDGSGDVTNDSDDDRSSPATPEYYIQ